MAACLRLGRLCSLPASLPASRHRLGAQPSAPRRAAAARRRPLVSAYQGDSERHRPKRPDAAAAAPDAAGDEAGGTTAAGGPAGAAAAGEAQWAKQLMGVLEELKDGQAQLLSDVNGLKKGQARLLRVTAGTFETALRGVPRSQRGSTVVNTAEQLLELCRLPAQDLVLVHAALAQPDTLHAFRAQLLKTFGRVGCAQAGKEASFKAAVAAWRAATATPSSEAQWLAEAASARKLLSVVKTNSQPHRAIRLWCSLCEAAAQDAAAPGSGGALLSLLQAAPAPLVWQHDVALQAALAGGCQCELELDAAIEFISTGGSTIILVEEVKLGGAGVSSAKAQLRQVIMMLAWLHVVLQRPLPNFIGSVVVPRAERREAERRLGRTLEEWLPVPQGRGAAHVTWELSTA